LRGFPLSGGNDYEFRLPENIGKPLNIDGGWVYCVKAIKESENKILRRLSRIRLDGSRMETLDEYYPPIVMNF
jgi:hypothetical protein